jgi:arylsulfatase A-like enzyme
MTSGPYDGEIPNVDSAVDKLFDQLRVRKLYENSPIAVMADHGEAFGYYEAEARFFYIIATPSGYLVGIRPVNPSFYVNSSVRLLRGD